MKRAIIAICVGVIVILILFISGITLLEWLDMSSLHTHALLQTDLSEMTFFSIIFLSVLAGGAIAARIKNHKVVSVIILLVLLVIIMISSGGRGLFANDTSSNITAYLLILIAPFLGQILTESLQKRG